MTGRVVGGPSGSVLIAVVVTALGCADSAQVPSRQLQQLVPDLSYRQWFTDATGYDTDSEFFGAYAIQPLGGVLYLGFGSGEPAMSDGGVLAKFDEDGLRSAALLDEQGLMDLATAGESILIPGVDPCCPDDWQFGNFYVYHPATGLTKRRNLPNVFHAWGAWYDEWDNAVYLATSAPGDSTVTIGQLWRTVDMGGSWELVADHENGVGDARTYDVIGQRERLYAVNGAVSEPLLTGSDASCALVAEPSLGSRWGNVLPGQRIACGQRLMNFGDWLVAVDSSRAVLHAIPWRQATQRIELPFSIAPATLNWATVAGEFMYVAAAGGQIMVTNDLTTWNSVTASPDELLAIQYWPERDQLVVSSRGSAAAVWTLQLCDGAPC